MSYRYYSPMHTLRNGTYPYWLSKSVKVVNFDKKTKVDDFFHPVWGYVEYQKPLTKKEMHEYQLYEPQPRR